jgi:hypothetical protein
MYRRETILASNISIDVPGRESFGEIPAANRDPAGVIAIKFKR